MRITIHNDFMRRSWVFFMTDDQGFAYQADPSGLIRSKFEPGQQLPPLLRLDAGDNTLQALADALANAGFVASQTDTKRELTATQAHLSDMRAMARAAFDALVKGKNG